MKKLYICKLSESERLNDVLARALSEVEAVEISAEELADGASGVLAKANVLFAFHVPANGIPVEALQLMGKMNDGTICLDGVTAGLVVDGESELFTKNIARQFIFSANRAGSAFVGKPLVEATGSLFNFNTSAKIKGLSNYDAYVESVRALAERLCKLEGPKEPDTSKKVLVLHASSRATSNTLLLWEMVKKNLPGNIEISELSVRNGEVIDCRGCAFEACRHFGENGDCFYGGIMVEKVYPEILGADALVLVCPNYNDSVSANIAAVFNRLTALFYNNDFGKKSVYAIVVSGYSGSDIVAEQVIGALSLNKGFFLPARFAMTETANDPKSILGIENIEDKAKAFAERIAERASW